MKKSQQIPGFPTKDNIDRFAARATANSVVGPRATRKADIPSSGKQLNLRDTSMGQFSPRKVNRQMAGD